MLNRKCIAGTVFVCMASSQFARTAFVPGEFITWSQESWGDDLNNSAAAQLLFNKFDFVYPLGGIELGIPGLDGYSMIFTSASATLTYLTTSGLPLWLNNDLLDPTSTSAGIFGGFVTALQLNLDFADAGLLNGSAGIPFADLRLVNMENARPGPFPLDLSELNGLTVRQFVGVANDYLGGGGGSASVNDFSVLAWCISEAFEGGAPSQYAQDHLVVPDPSAGALALLGLLGLVVHRNRRAAF